MQAERRAAHAGDEQHPHSEEPEDTDMEEEEGEEEAEDCRVAISQGGAAELLHELQRA
jgi:hypothetical protein